MANPLRAIARGVRSWAKTVSCRHVNLTKTRTFYAASEVEFHRGRRSVWRCADCGEDRLYSWHPESYRP